MGKYCTNCGTQLNTSAKFCPSCGAEVHRSPDTVQTHSPTPPAVSKKRKSPHAKLVFSGVAVVLVIALLVTQFPGLMNFLPMGSDVHIKEIGGQPYANRAITISGEGFGYYDSENCRATIDGKDTPIIDWEEKTITLLVPQDISAGKKEILLANPPFFKKKTVKHEFLENAKTELKRVMLTPAKESIVEGEGFIFIAPAGSVTQDQEIVIYKYSAPSFDDSPFWTVADEFEITGPDGGHLFFQKPVYFGLDATDAEEANHSAFQIYNEFSGLWVSAETWYDEGQARVYLSTTHFSNFRRFVSDMRTGFGRLAQNTVDEASKKIDYATEKLGNAKDEVVELSQNLWVNVKDATTEKFLRVTDNNERVIVYYRESDAKNDPSITDKAYLMAAAFSTAYQEYEDLFGADKVTSFSKKRLVSGSPGKNPVTEDVPDPINVYIDPRYNSTGAQAKSATTGNIIMPSEYPEDDLVSTCAHELFHTVQYRTLGLKQLYMSTTGLKDLLDNRFTGNTTEVYRFFANNAWFMEATAEYAGRFIGSNIGVGAPIHPSIEANRPYYASNGSHDYGISSFLDYILATRQPSSAERKDAFKEMWNTVTANYSMVSSINVVFDKYVQDKLNESAETAYLNFWREAFTRNFMPEVTVIAGGLLDTKAMPREKVSSTMDIRENGVGIFRYSLTPEYMWKDETALTRSFWFESTPTSMRGDVYRLDGIEMSDRESFEPHAGIINSVDGSLKNALIPYTLGESLGLVAVYQNMIGADETVKSVLSSTTVKWENQKDIEKKVGNTTLKSSDKLKFTPTLPKQTTGDEPFTALVTLNDSIDYQTEIERVENGKAFQVDAPMKDLPPDKVSVNIKIFKGEILVHEYQSAEIKADAKIEISGPATVRYELEKNSSQVEHSFSGKATPAGDYDFEWNFGDGSPAQRTTDGSSSEISHAYEGVGEYTVKLTLYDKKGKALSSDSVRIILEEKDLVTPTVPPVSSEPSVEPQQPGDPKYAWVLVDTIPRDQKADIENTNKGGIYQVSASSSPGNYTYSHEYIGETDTYPDPDQRSGESYATLLTMSVPPEVIKGGETVSISFNLSFTDDDISYFDGSGSARADWGNLKFVNSAKKNFFEIYSSVKYSSKNVKSINDTISAVIPNGNTEGQQEKLWTGGYTGTYYVYEWKQIP